MNFVFIFIFTSSLLPEVLCNRMYTEETSKNVKIKKKYVLMGRENNYKWKTKKNCEKK